MKKYLLDTCIVVFLSFSSIIKRYAKEKVATNGQGTPVADFDLLIGCSALENNLIRRAIAQ